MRNRSGNTSLLNDKRFGGIVKDVFFGFETQFRASTATPPTLQVNDFNSRYARLISRRTTIRTIAPTVATTIDPIIPPPTETPTTLNR